MKNNSYFLNLKRIGHDYEAARVERQARKQHIIDTFGWDSAEIKAWYAEDEAAVFPISQGVSKAYRAWASSIARQEDELNMLRICLFRDAHEKLPGLLAAESRLILREGGIGRVQVKISRVKYANSHISTP